MKLLVEIVGLQLIPGCLFVLLTFIDVEEFAEWRNLPSEFCRRLFPLNTKVFRKPKEMSAFG